MKKQYIGGNYLNSGAWTVCRFKKGLGEKEGVVCLLRGEINMVKICIANWKLFTFPSWWTSIQRKFSRESSIHILKNPSLFYLFSLFRKMCYPPTKSNILIKASSIFHFCFLQLPHFLFGISSFLIKNIGTCTIMLIFNFYPT